MAHFLTVVFEERGGVVASGVALTSVPDPIAVGEPVALAPGDRVFVGAWSCITLIDNRVPVGGANVSPES